jgi:hypothetical protein
METVLSLSKQKIKKGYIHTLTSPTVGGRSVGIVLLRTKATEFSF